MLIEIRIYRNGDNESSVALDAEAEAKLSGLTNGSMSPIDIARIIGAAIIAFDGINQVTDHPTLPFLTQTIHTGVLPLGTAN